MKLARYTRGDGETGLGLVNGELIRPLAEADMAVALQSMASGTEPRLASILAQLNRP